jgi:hypothetical protein
MGQQYNMDQQYKPSFVNFANITMTMDAFIVVLAGLFLFLFVSLVYGFESFYLLILLLYGITAYKINCMHIGSCHAFAKYLSIATFINVFLFIWFNNNKLQNKDISDNVIKNLKRLN